MKTLPILILVLWISVATEALVCQKCENFQGNICTNYINETCPQGVTRCYVNIMMEKMGEKIYYQSTRGCTKYIGSCINNFTMVVGTGVKMMVSTSYCCTGDLCNKRPIDLPPLDTKVNGLKCPACIKKGSACTSTETAICLGSQDRCFEFSGGVFNGTAYEDWAFKGCTTGNVCESCTRQYKKPLPLRRDYKLFCPNNPL
ncbi:phospholipase A2 inhibitor and Ly6/PLAUR domain-containing protein-like isoform X1 [Aquarana catesbeiana]|uniref:phospholipase A2 inhibitor and Ly6/PLAUR domain-containing protein-like isoform X1 n=1 Tax=Aquarana catesbeiana TaxID=8400 RepID=UPI003CC9BB74